VYDGSTVCIQADVHAAASHHDTSGPWDDVMDPLEQPRQRQLQRDDRSGGIYEQRGYDPSDDDDDDATVRDSDLDIEEQQSTVVATTVKDRREHSKGHKPPTSSTSGEGQCSDDISEAEAQIRHLINSLQYTTEGSGDEEVQLAFRAARQFEARRHGSPNYVEVAQ